MERFGSYEIYEQLGAGGLATVHLAKSPTIPNPVALKRLYPHIAKIPELVGAFVDEARLARYLRHPGIARVYEFGELRGVYFIAFEFVPGPTLQQLQGHCASHMGSMPIPIVLEIAHQLCDALDFAHTQPDERGMALKIVHRDVSPSNVIVSNSGQVKLIDFGLAKTKQSSVQSQAGVIKGKLNYVAPEYLSGRNLDARCDLWALGVIMYELLAGHRLFDSPEQEVILDRVRAMQIPPVSQSNPEVPPEVEAIVHRALERDPDKRWPRAGAMRAAIEKAAAGSRVTKEQLIAWTEWAFSQKDAVPDAGAASALHEILQSNQIEILGDLPAISEAMKQRRRESVAEASMSAAVRVGRGPGERWLWIGIALVALALVAVVLLGT